MVVDLLAVLILLPADLSACLPPPALWRLVGCRRYVNFSLFAAVLFPGVYLLAVLILLPAGVLCGRERGMEWRRELEGPVGCVAKGLGVFSFSTSVRTWVPAEFKHITKRRKRN